VWNGYFHDNYIWDCSGSGLQLGPGCNSSVTDYNTIDVTGLAGIVLWSDSSYGAPPTFNNDVHHNLITNGTGYSLEDFHSGEQAGSGSNQFRNNYLFNNASGFGIAAPTGATFTSNINGADPLYTNRASHIYTLTGGSPATGYGVSSLKSGGGPPAAPVSSITEGAVLSGVVTWTATSIQVGAQFVKFWADNVMLQSIANPSTSESYTLDTRIYADGAHIVGIGWTDASGQSYPASPPTNITIDNRVKRAGLVRNLGSAVSDVAGTTLAMTHAVPVPAGETIIVRLSHEYTNGGPTCTDTRVNNYVRERTSGSVGATIGPPIAGVRNSTFRCYVTTPIQVGDTTTVTLAASVTSKAMVVDQFTYLQNAVDAVNGYSGTGAGFGDSTTIVGTSFTTIAQNVVILNILYTREAVGAALELNPANAPLAQAASSAATNQVRVAGGWKTVYRAGLQNFDFKLASGVSFQIHQLSIPLVAAPVETRDYLTVATELGANALFKFSESTGAFQNAIAGASSSASTTGTVSRRVNTPVASIPGGGVAVNGTSGNYVEIADHAAFSVATTGQLTIALWVRPDTLQATLVEGEDPPAADGQYLHFGGKAIDGSPNVYEWLFRIYNKFRADGVTLNNRPNRMSAYHFNPSGGLGSGSYFQDALTAGDWIFVAVAFNSVGPAIYRDGSWRDGDFYSDYGITPTDTATPVRLGTAVKQSWFQGAFGPLVFFPRRLTDDEIFRLYQSSFNRQASGRAILGVR
jgi:hypothetical protein